MEWIEFADGLPLEPDLSPTRAGATDRMAVAPVCWPACTPH